MTPSVLEIRSRKPEETIRILEEELAETNREVLALTLELDKRMHELAMAEERYRLLAENAPDVILRYEFTPQRVCTFVNPRITALTGYTPEEYCADSDLALRLVHPDDRSVMEAVFRGESQNPGTTTLRWVHRNGALLWIEQHHSLTRDEQGRPVVMECVARDITDRKRLQEQLLQAQKMEAIGRLAGGVAHDFNNLLTVINGYGGDILDQMSSGEPWYREIEEIHKAGERASSLTRQLLAFSRQQAFSPRALDLNATVTDMDRLLRRLLGEDILLTTVLDSRLGAILADPGYIEQIVMNLAVNSRDAMPDGGKLLIETANVQLEDSSARLHGDIKPGSWVMLAVSDTGCGMDEETQAHIFEPFFTTKPQGQGTGLGLSTVFGIVHQTGGFIQVHSDPGKGTTFRVYFPRAERGNNRAVQSSRAAIPTGTETVLIVEDEDAVRALMISVLKRAGYSPLEARNGTEALRLCENHEDPIHLVISDMVMPEINGPALVKQLKALRPEIKVLFVSGYAANAMGEDAVSNSQTHFLQKPFTAAGLARKVRESIDGT